MEAHFHRVGLAGRRGVIPAGPAVDVYIPDKAALWVRQATPDPVLSDHALTGRPGSASGGTVPGPAQPRRLGAVAARIARRVLKASDGAAVATMTAREFSLTLRSAHFRKFLAVWQAFCALLVLTPLLYRSQLGLWNHPDGRLWYLILAHCFAVGAAFLSAQWAMRRLRRDLYTSRLDELLLTRCTAGDVALGVGLASGMAAALLVSTGLPACLLMTALAGAGPGSAVALLATAMLAAMLGVWFGMGWGLAFASRAAGAIWPMTQWWILAPLTPVIVAWSLLGAFPILWLLLGLVPGGQAVVEVVASAARSLVLYLLQSWNPLLVIGASIGEWGAPWVTSWAALLAMTIFLTAKSAEAIQIALAALQERGAARRRSDAWIHHDVHYFLDYGQDSRRHPHYRDGANAVAAFDVALGHRVFIHPFLWCLALMAYLFFLGWTMLVPDLGRWTATAAVLIPATAALLMMSCGVAISFGWERDQDRWMGLAALPMTDAQLALGKIKGVVRPTLWLNLLAAVTAVVIGWRGAVPMTIAWWMALHVLVFPVALAFASATLALTTPTIGEAISRWAVLGAIPTFAYLLPPPIGGDSGIALPISPPLMVLVLVAHGPTSELIAACWAALALEIFGVMLALLILGYFLRRWTVGEK